MENNEIKRQEIDQTMELDGSMMSVLNEMRKWTKFLAVMGFIGIGFMMLMGIIASITASAVSNAPGMPAMPFPPGIIGFIYVIFAGIMVFPVILLNNFSNKMKEALYTKDHIALYKAFNNLKRYYKFIGILIIIYLLILGAIIVGGGLMALVAGI